MKGLKLLLFLLAVLVVSTPAFGIQMIITEGDVSGSIDLTANYDRVQDQDWDHLWIYLDGFDPISANVDVYLRGPDYDDTYNVLYYEGNSGSIYDNEDPYGRTFSITADVYVTAEEWVMDHPIYNLPFALGVEYKALDMTITIDGEQYHLYAESVPVPEPATMLLLGTGLVGLAGYGRKKFKK